ncbi:MAG: helix-turn-helix transcriptional regulator [Polaromonas sp.]
MIEQMTGAELQTLRESCGLSREEFGLLASVQARTVKHWENGHSATVPADAQELARNLDQSVSAAVAADLAPLAGLQAGEAATLTRYQDAYSLKQSRPDLAGLPLGLHGAIVGRVRLALLARGAKVRIDWAPAGS